MCSRRREVGLAKWGRRKPIRTLDWLGEETGNISVNLNYQIQCNKCNIQYIGEPKRHLSDRFGEHRRAIEKAITQQHIDQPTAVSEHFTLPANSMDNIELVPLELITSNRDAIRLQQAALSPR